MRDDAAEILSRLFTLLETRIYLLNELLLREQDLEHVIRTRPDDTGNSLDECGDVIERIIILDHDITATREKLALLAGVPSCDLEQAVYADSADAMKRWMTLTDSINDLADRIKKLRKESISLMEKEHDRIRQDEKELKKLRELGNRFGL